MNLLSNSIDAIPDKGQIEVSSGVKNKISWLSVSDSGIGIEPKIRNHVFDLGYTSKRTGTGTGMGLYIVKELCTSLHISIAFESIPEKGTTFTLQFPG